MQTNKVHTDVIHYPAIAEKWEEKFKCNHTRSAPAAPFSMMMMKMNLCPDSPQHKKLQHQFTELVEPRDMDTQLEFIKTGFQLVVTLSSSFCMNNSNHEQFTNIYSDNAGEKTTGSLVPLT